MMALLEGKELSTVTAIEVPDPAPPDIRIYECVLDNYLDAKRMDLEKLRPQYRTKTFRRVYGIQEPLLYQEI